MEDLRSAGRRIVPLYASVRDGVLVRVGVLDHTSARTRSIRLNDAEADVYVAGGCDALAKRLGLRLPADVGVVGGGERGDGSRRPGVRS